MRLTVLEWQSRPAEKLLREDAAASARANGVRGAALPFAASKSVNLTNSSFVSKYELSSFDKPASRRQRLLELYLSERRFITKTCEHIIFAALCESTAQDAKGKSARRTDWITRLGEEILSSWNIQGNVRDTDKNFYTGAIEAFNVRMQNLESGSAWLKDEDNQEELETSFARAQVLETIHIMQIILVLLESSSSLSRSDVCLGWFKLMAMFGFFENFQPVSTSPKSYFSTDLEL